MPYWLRNNSDKATLTYYPQISTQVENEGLFYNNVTVCVSLVSAERKNNIIYTVGLIHNTVILKSFYFSNIILIDNASTVFER